MLRRPSNSSSQRARPQGRAARYWLAAVIFAISSAEAADPPAKAPTPAHLLKANIARKVPNIFPPWPGSIMRKNPPQENGVLIDYNGPDSVPFDPKHGPFANLTGGNWIYSPSAFSLASYNVSQLTEACIILAANEEREKSDAKLTPDLLKKLPPNTYLEFFGGYGGKTNAEITEKLLKDFITASDLPEKDPLPGEAALKLPTRFVIFYDWVRAYQENRKRKPPPTCDGNIGPRYSALLVLKELKNEQERLDLPPVPKEISQAFEAVAAGKATKAQLRRVRSLVSWRAAHDRPEGPLGSALNSFQYILDQSCHDESTQSFAQLCRTFEDVGHRSAERESLVVGHLEPKNRALYDQAAEACPWLSPDARRHLASLATEAPKILEILALLANESNYLPDSKGAKDLALDACRRIETAITVTDRKKVDSNDTLLGSLYYAAGNAIEKHNLNPSQAYPALGLGKPGDKIDAAAVRRVHDQVNAAKDKRPGAWGELALLKAVEKSLGDAPKVDGEFEKVANEKDLSKRMALAQQNADEFLSLCRIVGAAKEKKTNILLLKNFSAKYLTGDLRVDQPLDPLIEKIRARLNRDMLASMEGISDADVEKMLDQQAAKRGPGDVAPERIRPELLLFLSLRAQTNKTPGNVKLLARALTAGMNGRAWNDSLFDTLYGLGKGDGDLFALPRNRLLELRNQLLQHIRTYRNDQRRNGRSVWDETPVDDTDANLTNLLVLMDRALFAAPHPASAVKDACLFPELPSLYADRQTTPVDRMGWESTNADVVKACEWPLHVDAGKPNFRRSFDALKLPTSAHYQFLNAFVKNGGAEACRFLERELLPDLEKFDRTVDFPRFLKRVEPFLTRTTPDPALAHALEQLTGAAPGSLTGAHAKTALGNDGYTEAPPKTLAPMDEATWRAAYRQALKAIQRDNPASAHALVAYLKNPKVRPLGAVSPEGDLGAVKVGRFEPFRQGKDDLAHALKQNIDVFRLSCSIAQSSERVGESKGLIDEFGKDYFKYPLSLTMPPKELAAGVQVQLNAEFAKAMKEASPEELLKLAQSGKLDAQTALYLDTHAQDAGKNSKSILLGTLLANLLQKSAVTPEVARLVTLANRLRDGKPLSETASRELNVAAVEAMQLRQRIRAQHAVAKAIRPLPLPENPSGTPLDDLDGALASLLIAIDRTITPSDSPAAANLLHPCALPPTPVVFADERMEKYEKNRALLAAKFVEVCGRSLNPRSLDRIDPSRNLDPLQFTFLFSLLQSAGTGVCPIVVEALAPQPYDRKDSKIPPAEAKVETDKRFNKLLTQIPGYFTRTAPYAGTAPLLAELAGLSPSLLPFSDALVKSPNGAIRYASTKPILVTPPKDDRWRNIEWVVAKAGTPDNGPPNEAALALLQMLHRPNIRPTSSPNGARDYFPARTKEQEKLPKLVFDKANFEDATATPIVVHNASEGLVELTNLADTVRTGTLHGHDGQFRPVRFNFEALRGTELALLQSHAGKILDGLDGKPVSGSNLLSAIEAIQRLPNHQKAQFRAMLLSWKGRLRSDGPEVVVRDKPFHDLSTTTFGASNKEGKPVRTFDELYQHLADTLRDDTDSVIDKWLGDLQSPGITWTAIAERKLEPNGNPRLLEWLAAQGLKRREGSPDKLSPDEVKRAIDLVLAQHLRQVKMTEDALAQARALGVVASSPLNLWRSEPFQQAALALTPHADLIDRQGVPFVVKQSTAAAYYESVAAHRLGKKQGGHEFAFWQKLASMGAGIPVPPLGNSKSLLHLLETGDPALDDRELDGLVQWALDSKQPSHLNSPTEIRDWEDGRMLAYQIVRSYRYKRNQAEFRKSEPELAKYFDARPTNVSSAVRLDQTLLDVSGAADDFPREEGGRFVKALLQQYEGCGPSMRALILEMAPLVAKQPVSIQRYLQAIAEAPRMLREDVTRPSGPELAKDPGRCRFLLHAMTRTAHGDLDFLAKKYQPPMNPLWLGKVSRASIFQAAMNELLATPPVKPYDVTVTRLVSDPATKVSLAMLAEAMGYSDIDKLLLEVAALAKDRKNFESSVAEATLIDPRSGAAMFLKELEPWLELPTPARQALVHHFVDQGVPGPRALTTLATLPIWKDATADSKAEPGTVKSLALGELPVRSLVRLAQHQPAELRAWRDELEKTDGRWDNVLSAIPSPLRDWVHSYGFDPKRRVIASLEDRVATAVAASLHEEPQVASWETPEDPIAERVQKWRSNVRRLEAIRARLAKRDFTWRELIRYLDEDGFYQQMTGRTFRRTLEAYLPDTFRQEFELSDPTKKDAIAAFLDARVTSGQYVVKARLRPEKAEDYFFGELDHLIGGQLLQFRYALAGGVAVPRVQGKRSADAKVLPVAVPGEGDDDEDENSLPPIFGGLPPVPPAAPVAPAAVPPKPGEAPVGKPLSPDELRRQTLDLDPAVATHDLSLTLALLDDPHSTKLSPEEREKYFKFRADFLAQRIPDHADLVARTRVTTETNSTSAEMALHERAKETLASERKEFDLLKRKLYGTQCGADDLGTPVGRVTVRRKITLSDRKTGWFDRYFEKKDPPTDNSLADKGVNAKTKDKDDAESPKVDLEFQLPNDRIVLARPGAWQDAGRILMTEKPELFARAKEIADKVDEKELYRLNQILKLPGESAEFRAAVFLALGQRVNSQPFKKEYPQMNRVRDFINASLDNAFNVEVKADLERKYRIAYQHVGTGTNVVTNNQVTRYVGQRILGFNWLLQMPTVSPAELELEIAKADNPKSEQQQLLDGLAAQGVGTAHAGGRKIDLQPLIAELAAGREPKITDPQLPFYRAAVSALPFDHPLRQFLYKRTLPPRAQAFVGWDSEKNVAFVSRANRLPQAICMELWARKDRLRDQKAFEDITEIAFRNQVNAMKVDGILTDEGEGPRKLIKEWTEKLVGAQTPEARERLEITGPDIERSFRGERPEVVSTYRDSLRWTRETLARNLDDFRGKHGRDYRPTEASDEMTAVADLQNKLKRVSSMYPSHARKAALERAKAWMERAAEAEKANAASKLPLLRKTVDDVAAHLKQAFGAYARLPVYARWMDLLTQAFAEAQRIAAKPDLASARQAKDPIRAALVLISGEALQLPQGMRPEFVSLIANIIKKLDAAFQRGGLNVGVWERDNARDVLAAELDPTGRERGLYQHIPELTAAAPAQPALVPINERYFTDLEASLSVRQYPEEVYLLMANHGLTLPAALAKYDEILDRSLKEVDAHLLKGNKGVGERLFERDFHSEDPHARTADGGKCNYDPQDEGKLDRRNARVPIDTYHYFVERCGDSDPSNIQPHSEYEDWDIRKFNPPLAYREPDKHTRFGLPGASITALYNLPDTAQQALRFLVDRHMVRAFGRCEVLTPAQEQWYKLPRARSGYLTKDKLAKLILNPSPQAIFNTISSNEDLRREYLDFVTGKPAPEDRDGDLTPPDDDKTEKNVVKYLEDRQTYKWRMMKNFSSVKPEYEATWLDELNREDVAKGMKVMAQALRASLERDVQAILNDDTIPPWKARLMVDKRVSELDNPKYLVGLLNHEIHNDPTLGKRMIDSTKWLDGGAFSANETYRGRREWAIQAQALRVNFTGEALPKVPTDADRSQWGLDYASDIVKALEVDKTMLEILQSNRDEWRRYYLDQLQRRETRLRARELAPFGQSLDAAKVPKFENMTVADLRAHLERISTYGEDERQKLRRAAYAHLTAVAKQDQANGPGVRSELTNLYILLANFDQDTGRQDSYGLRQCSDRDNSRYTVYGAINHLDRYLSLEKPEAPAPAPAPELPLLKPLAGGKMENVPEPKKPAPKPKPGAFGPMPAVAVAPEQAPPEFVDHYKKHILGRQQMQGRLETLPSVTFLEGELDLVPASVRKDVATGMREAAAHADPAARSLESADKFKKLFGDKVPDEWLTEFLGRLQAEQKFLFKQLDALDPETKAKLQKVNAFDAAIFKTLGLWKEDGTPGENWEKAKKLLYDAMTRASGGHVLDPTWMRTMGLTGSNDDVVEKRRVFERLATFLNGKFRETHDQVKEVHNSVLGVAGRTRIPPPEWINTMRQLPAFEQQLLRRLEQLLLVELPGIGAKETRNIFDEILLNPTRQRLIAALQAYDPEYLQLVLGVQEPARQGQRVKEYLRDQAFLAALEPKLRPKVDVVDPAIFGDFLGWARMTLVQNQKDVLEGRLVQGVNQEDQRKRALKWFSEDMLKGSALMPPDQLRLAYFQYREARKKLFDEPDVKKRDQLVARLDESDPFLNHLRVSEDHIRLQASELVLQPRPDSKLKPLTQDELYLVLNRDWRNVGDIPDVPRARENLAYYQGNPEAMEELTDVAEALTAVLGTPSTHSGAYVQRKPGNGGDTLAVARGGLQDEHLRMVQKALSRAELNGDGKSCGGDPNFAATADAIATKWVQRLEDGNRAAGGKELDCRTQMKEFRKRRQAAEHVSSLNLGQARQAFEKAKKEVKRFKALVDDLKRTQKLLVSETELKKLPQADKTTKTERQASAKSMTREQRELELPKVEELLRRYQVKLTAAERGFTATLQSLEKVFDKHELLVAKQDDEEAKTEAACVGRQQIGTTSENAKLLGLIEDEAMAAIEKDPYGAGGFLPAIAKTVGDAPNPLGAIRLAAVKKLRAEGAARKKTLNQVLGAEGASFDANAWAARLDMVIAFAQAKRTARDLGARAAQSQARKADKKFQNGQNTFQPDQEPLETSLPLLVAPLCGSMGSIVKKAYEDKKAEVLKTAEKDSNDLRELLQKLRKKYGIEYDGRTINWDKIQWASKPGQEPRGSKRDDETGEWGPTDKKYRDDLMADLAKLGPLIRRTSLEATEDEKLLTIKGYGSVDLSEELETQIVSAWYAEGGPKDWIPFNKTTAVRVTPEILGDKIHWKIDFAPLEEMQRDATMVNSLISQEIAAHSKIYTDLRNAKDEGLFGWLGAEVLPTVPGALAQVTRIWGGTPPVEPRWMKRLREDRWEDYGKEEAVEKRHNEVMPKYIEALRKYGRIPLQLGAASGEDQADHYQQEWDDRMIVDQDYLHEAVYEDEYSRNVQYIEILGEVALTVVPSGAGQVAGALAASKRIMSVVGWAGKAARALKTAADAYKGTKYATDLAIGGARLTAKAYSAAQGLNKFLHLPGAMKFHYGMQMGTAAAAQQGFGKAPNMGQSENELYKTWLMFFVQGQVSQGLTALGSVAGLGVRTTQLASNMTGFFAGSYVSGMAFDYTEGKDMFAAHRKHLWESAKMAPLGAAGAGKLAGPLSFMTMDMGMLALERYVFDDEQGRQHKLRMQQEGLTFFDLMKEKFVGNWWMYYDVHRQGVHATEVRQLRQGIEATLKDSTLDAAAKKAAVEKLLSDYGERAVDRKRSLTNFLLNAPVGHFHGSPLKGSPEGKEREKAIQKESDAIVAEILNAYDLPTLQRLLTGDAPPSFWTWLRQGDPGKAPAKTAEAHSVADIFADAIWRSREEASNPKAKDGDTRNPPTVDGKPLAKFTGADLLAALREYANKDAKGFQVLWDTRRSGSVASHLDRILEIVQKRAKAAPPPPPAPLPSLPDFRKGYAEAAAKGIEAERDFLLQSLSKVLAHPASSKEARDMLAEIFAQLGPKRRKEHGLVLEALLRRPEWHDYFLELPEAERTRHLLVYMNNGPGRVSNRQARMMDLAMSVTKDPTVPKLNAIRQTLDVLFRKSWNERLRTMDSDPVRAEVLAQEGRNIETIWNTFVGELNAANPLFFSQHKGLLSSPRTRLIANDVFPMELLTADRAPFFTSIIEANAQTKTPLTVAVISDLKRKSGRTLTAQFENVGGAMVATVSYPRGSRVEAEAAQAEARRLFPTAEVTLTEVSGYYHLDVQTKGEATDQRIPVPEIRRANGQFLEWLANQP